MIVFLDIEASGLHPTSYPVEVGWCRQDLTAAWSSLIRPAPAWGEDDWSPAAESIHRIGRLQAQFAGLPVDEVAAKLNSDLAGKVVMSDNPEADSTWIWRAFLEAKASPAFSLTRPIMHHQGERTAEDLASLDAMDVGLLIARHASPLGLSFSATEAIGNELRAAAGIMPHRALDDAIGHALDLAAVALIQAARDHGEQAAAALRGELVRRGRALLKEHGRLMTAKEREQARFRFCAAVARGQAAPTTRGEAQLVLLAAALLGARPEAARLQHVGDKFFSDLNEEPMSLQDFLRQGIVRDLPRFSDGVKAALSDGDGEL